jgi:hypothetical protein
MRVSLESRRSVAPCEKNLNLSFFKSQAQARTFITGGEKTLLPITSKYCKNSSLFSQKYHKFFQAVARQQRLYPQTSTLHSGHVNQRMNGDDKGAGPMPPLSTVISNSSPPLMVWWM